MSTLQLVVLKLGLLGIHLCVALLLVLGEQALCPAAVLMVPWKAERKCGDKLVIEGTTKGDPEAGARATVLARGEEDLLPLA